MMRTILGTGLAAYFITGDMTTSMYIAGGAVVGTMAVGMVI